MRKTYKKFLIIDGENKKRKVTLKYYNGYPVYTYMKHKKEYWYLLTKIANSNLL